MQRAIGSSRLIIDELVQNLARLSNLYPRSEFLFEKRDAGLIFFWLFPLSRILTTATQSKTGNTYQNVGANISGLVASTTYHFRIVASNSGGTRCGSERTFISL